MIFYVGYYNCETIRNERRIVAPASENKMNYIISAISEAINDEYEVVSPAETQLHRVVKGKKQKLNNQVTLKTFLSFSSDNKLIRIIGHLITRLSFWMYLLINVNSEDHLIVYHSLAYMKWFQLFRKIKKFRFTLEVEELYSDVTDDELLHKKEIDYLQIADSYLFITDLLRKEVNIEKKSIISHGTYKSIQDLNLHFNDDKIHVVYAGTFRKAKGGVYVAISAAEYLDDRYVLEILGNGSESEIEEVKNLIEDLSKKTKCKINYVGFKTGNSFNEYIQACQIGLSTQQVDAKFNATSFPSKVLMYMSNGLKVVSVRIPAIETSKVGKYIYYYDVQDAKEIAEIIRSVSINDEYESRKLLDILHREFVEDFRKLLQE